ncbi:hypothetical protein SAMN05444271_11928 [Halohasta litchfieldiae]|uniref:Uncharacterized protein n=1 Tax=Halohasta litchfieldiae TaxID=1073996 RepID=A0A1H6W2J1_9EURY|nr:hypothetical protein SAMN05444271_11928 [Halohasta litchfieldiae]
MGVTWISCFLASIIFKYFDNCSVSTMKSFMIEIVFIWNINLNSISNLKSSH